MRHFTTFASPIRSDAIGKEPDGGDAVSKSQKDQVGLQETLRMLSWT